MSLERAVADLEERTKEEQQSFENAFLDVAFDHPDPVLRQQIVRAAESVPASKLRLAVLGAVMNGCLTVFVGHRHQAHAHKTHPDLWRRGFAHIANPVTMVLSGKFVPVCALLAGDSLEADLSGADLFVKKSEFKSLTRLKGVSEAGIERKARQIVDDYVAQNPGDRMTNAEICQKLRGYLPIASERALERAIAKVKPPEWTRAGRWRGNR